MMPSGPSQVVSDEPVSDQPRATVEAKRCTTLREESWQRAEDHLPCADLTRRSALSTRIVSTPLLGQGALQVSWIGPLLAPKRPMGRFRLL